MVLAIAALMFNFGTAVQAVPAAAASAAKAAAAQPAPAVATLPDAPLPSSATASPAAPAPASSNSMHAEENRPAAALRVAELDASGNNTQQLSTIHLVEADPKPFTRVTVDQVPSRKKWLALSIAEHGAATFDAYSTRYAVENGATEDNPFLRPFAHSDGIYAAIQVCPLVLDFTARHMQRSENPLLRHTWWVPQSVGTGIFLFSGAHNMQVGSSH
jgi:hypothetical protein